jgi:indole-3-glycerol phosphate synthase
MNYLTSILNHKRGEIEESRKREPLERLKDCPEYTAPTRSFSGSLWSNSPAIIAEIKKASPSRDVIRPEFDPVAIARQYAGAGAAALSVLTDYSYFRGTLEYLEQVKAVVPLPVLRKDFILDPYQVHESRARGADAILLIAAALEPAELRDLGALARELGLESLVEVHSQEEIEALEFPSIQMIGINNRDLSTFATDLGITVRLRPLIPPEILVVSESGITSGAQLKGLMDLGIGAFLIGEAFMRAADPGQALRQILREAEVL